MIRIRNQKIYYKELIGVSVFYVHCHLGFYSARAEQTYSLPWKGKA